MGKVIIEFNNDREVLEILDTKNYYFEEGHLVIIGKNNSKTFIKEDIINIIRYL